MQADGSHHQQANLSAAHEGTSRQQGCKGLPQPHLIGQNGTTTGQKPTDAGALMAKRATAILQGFIEIRGSHQGAMRWQRREGVPAPVEPLLQRGGDRKTAPQCLLKRISCSQREIPAMACSVPTPSRLDPTQLGLGHSIKRTDHTNQTLWREIQTTIQCGF